MLERPGSTVIACMRPAVRKGRQFGTTVYKLTRTMLKLYRQLKTSFPVALTFYLSEHWL